jgi:hypothetical protein
MKLTAFHLVILILLLFSITDSVLLADPEGEVPKKNIFWSFKEPQKKPLPEKSPRAVNEIDIFIFDRLKMENLLPQIPASKEEWIRRVSLDLTGLPPTIAEIDAFISDRSEHAFAMVVERLLSSFRYGERMASWWLDGARYGDSHGYDNDLENSQWPWRNWVIESFNFNKPFDIFTIEQLAGDLLPDPTNDQIIATGFNRNHRIQTEGGAIDEEWRTEYVIDRVETMGTVWLGLTLSCARCHDHKYDPITQKEFFQFFSLFNNLEEKGFINNLRGSAEPRIRYKAQEFELNSEKIRTEIKDKGSQEKEIAKLEQLFPTVMIMKEMPEPRKAFVLDRGQYDSPTEEVFPGLPESLPSLQEGESMTRLGLARWLVNGQHPLTSRVLVNRLWAQFFGHGIVMTTEDLGAQSERPSHPELLDWLAVDFVENGWDIKRLIKKIVLSATYSQTHFVDKNRLRKDPENRLLSRGPRQRLQAEMLRDQALTISGLLVEKQGGPSVWTYQPKGLWEEIEKRGKFVQDHGDKLYRRTLYTRIRRTVPHPSMVLFDMPSREVCSVLRARSNTPLQALSLLNNVTYVEAAKKFAERMMLHGDSIKDQLRWGFRAATARYPIDTEMAILLRGYERRFLHYEQNPDRAKALLLAGESKISNELNVIRAAAMTTVANLILNLDEVINK